MMQAISFDLDDGSKVNSEIIKKFELKFSTTYTNFISKNSVDIIRKIVNIDKKELKYLKKTRAEAKTYAIEAKSRDREDVYNDIRDKCYTTTKHVHDSATAINKHKLIGDPFKKLHYETRSSVQLKMEENLKKLPVFGAYAYSCSCGAGKTLAGIFTLYSLQLQTVIVSTRNAVNDQWMTQLHSLYPRLTIYDNLKRNDGDVYVLTPQLICNYLDKFPITPGLIIYDEVHSMLATKYIQALLLPMYLVNSDSMEELPYMIALSATYPSPATNAYKYICKLFGKPVVCPSTITSIPVNIYDYYDHYPMCSAEVIRHSKFDKYYPKLNDIEALKDAFDMIDENRDDYFRINPRDTKYKGIVMTYTIFTSLLAARYLHDRYNCNVLLVRTEDKPPVLFKANVKYDYSKLPDMDYNDYTSELSNEKLLEGLTGDDDNGEDVVSKIDVQDLLHNGIGEKYDFHNLGFDDISIIVSTVQRLKEGFSVQYATWGVCTKFVWSQISRVQILGRIRRSSSDEELNKQRRIMICYSAPRPSNAHIPRKRRYKNKVDWTYDIEYEASLFAKENYIRI